MSDSNYKKVSLSGPSIDQVVHPPASADFAHNAGGSGDKVDVDVDLKVTIVGSSS